MIAETADVDPRATIDDSARIWHLAQVREGATIGRNVIVGRGAYIDTGVVIGDHCKIQNYALIYSPAHLEDGVFVGPAAVFTNDRFPRSVDAAGKLKDAADWEATGVTVRRGASIGARAVVLGGIELGAWSLVAAGAVVTRDVPPHALVAGVPARQIGWVGISGQTLVAKGDGFEDPSDSTYYELDGSELRPT